APGGTAARRHRRTRRERPPTRRRWRARSRGRKPRRAPRSSPGAASRRAPLAADGSHAAPRVEALHARGRGRRFGRVLDGADFVAPADRALRRAVAPCLARDLGLARSTEPHDALLSGPWPG